MHWSYDELLDLPFEIYAVLVDEVNREIAAQRSPADRPQLPNPVTWP